MKKYIKYLLLFLLTTLFVSCDLIFSDEDDPVKNTYVDEIINNFMDELSGKVSSSNRLSDSEIKEMKDDIIETIREEELDDSKNLSKIIPIIASSAQISLKDLANDAEKIKYIKAISRASLAVISNNTDGVSQTVVANIVISVSVAMVESISETGLPPKMIMETTQATVSSIIEALESVELDHDLILTTVYTIANKSSIAVANNNGITTAILTETLSSLPYIISKTVESIDGMVLNSVETKTLLTEIFSSVAKSIVAINSDNSVNLDIDTTDLLITIQEVLIEKVKNDSDYTSFLDEINEDLTSESIAVVYSNEELRAELENKLSESKILDLTDEEITEAGTTAEDIVKEDTLLPAEEYEEAGLVFLKDNLFNKALEKFQKAVNTGAASPQGKLWWSMLTLASISVDKNVLDVVDNLGIENYPTTLNGLVGIEDDMIEKVLTDTDTYIDDTDTEITENYYESVFKHVKNQELFIKADNSYLPEAQILAVLYNIQKNYPDGLNSIADSVNDALSEIDNVVKVLLTISDDASLSYTYKMFNNSDFVAGKNSWPTKTDNNSNITPMDITVGKAEIYSIVSGLELTRSMFLMAQSVSLSGDLGSYWDIFNLLDGTLYTFKDEKILGISESFDWSTVKNPLTDGFLYTRNDANTILAEAKVRFTNSFKYIKLSSEMIVTRDKNSQFFLSPANEHITSEVWGNVKSIQSIGAVVADKVINSLDNSSVVYFPDFSTIKSLDDALIYADVTTWPTSGYGINFGTLFSKPLFALDSLLDIADNGEIVFYVYDGTTYSVATTFVDETYYIKFKDTTFNGLLSGFNSLIPEEINVQADNSIFIKLLSEMNVMVGSSLMTAGTKFTIDGKEYVSTGTFFGSLIRDIVISEIEVE